MNVLIKLTEEMIEAIKTGGYTASNFRSCERPLNYPEERVAFDVMVNGKKYVVITALFLTADQQASLKSLVETEKGRCLGSRYWRTSASDIINDILKDQRRVAFRKSDSVLNVLKRELKEHGYTVSRHDNQDKTCHFDCLEYIHVFGDNLLTGVYIYINDNKIFLVIDKDKYKIDISNPTINPLDKILSVLKALDVKSIGLEKEPRDR